MCFPKRNGGIIFHTDCTQAVGHMPVSARLLHADLVSFSAHKMHGPKGVGALFVSDDVQAVIKPIIHGGDQEKRLRGGTTNTPAVVGFGEAARQLADIDLREIFVVLQTRRDQWIEQLAERARVFGLSIDFVTPKNHAGHILSFRIDGVDGESLQSLLSTTENIYVATGSACHSTSNTPSHVLTAMGLTEQQARSSIRISYTIDQPPKTTIPYCADKILRCAKELKDMGEAIADEEEE